MKTLREWLVQGLFFSTGKALAAASRLPPVRGFLAGGDFSVEVRAGNGGPGLAVHNRGGRISCGKGPEAPGLELAFRDAPALFRFGRVLLRDPAGLPFSLPQAVLGRVLEGDLEVSGNPVEVFSLLERLAELLRLARVEKLSGAAAFSLAGRNLPGAPVR